MNPSPGPWKWTDGLSGPRWEAADGTVLTGAYGDAFSRDTETLIAAAPEMREMLLKLEWADTDGAGWGTICHECCAFKDNGGGDPRPGFGKHNPGCTLAALLERIR